MTVIDDQMPRQAKVPRSKLIEANLPWPVVLYLFCVTIPISFEVGPLAMTTLRMMLMAVTVPLMVQILSGRYGRVLITDILFCTHILWAGVALFFNHTPSIAIQQVGSVSIEFLGGYAIGRAFIRTPETFRALCKLLVFVVAFSFPFVVIESQTGWAIILDFLNRVPFISAYEDLQNDERLGMYRSQFTFVHPIHYGIFCVLVFSLAWIALKNSISPTWRIILTMVVGLCAFFSLSAGAFLAIALQLGLFIWAAMFAKAKARWWILLGVCVLTYIIIDVLSNRTPIRVFMSYATLSAHTAYWRLLIFEWGLINIQNNPVFGIGLRDWSRPEWMYSNSVDNFWLLTAMRYGLPGFFFLLVGYFSSLVWIVFRDFSNWPEVNQLRLSWAYTFVGITFVLCTVHIWSNLYSFVFFMYGAGMWLSNYSAASSTSSQNGVLKSRHELPFSRFHGKATLRYAQDP